VFHFQKLDRFGTGSFRVDTASDRKIGRGFAGGLSKAAVNFRTVRDCSKKTHAEFLKKDQGLG
jgi:hypothetical protein